MSEAENPFPPLNIEGLDLAGLLVAIHREGNRPQTLGMRHEPLTIEVSRELVAKYAPTSQALRDIGAVFSCDYVEGVKIKGTFTKTEWRGWVVFDRDAGRGAAARVVAGLRTPPHDP